MEETKELPILIVNYNTPDIVYYNILSINKSTPNAKIYVFDNSDDGTIFDGSKFDNVTVLDNTKEVLLEKDEHSSKTHSNSIQYCFDTLGEDEFVVLDSDVIVKKNLNEMRDDSYIATGMIYDGRILPCCCYINVKECKKRGIYYSNRNSITFIDGIFHDTGYDFTERIKRYENSFKEMDINEYVLHLWGGSRREDKRTATDNFIKDNRQYWENNG